MPLANQASAAALSALVILQLVMLGALYAGVPPHPPAATPLFAIAPFLGASLSATIAALLLGPMTSRAGRGLSLVSVLMALVSFGPQKYADPQFALIWPAVIAGQLACLVACQQLWSGFRSNSPTSRSREVA